MESRYKFRRALEGSQTSSTRSMPNVNVRIPYNCPFRSIYHSGRKSQCKLNVSDSAVACFLVVFLGKFDANGDLVVAVIPTGLCKVDFKTKAVSILANYAEGAPILYPDHLDIASDGKIYFTDATKVCGLSRFCYRIFP